MPDQRATLGSPARAATGRPHETRCLGVNEAESLCSRVLFSRLAPVVLGDAELLEDGLGVHDPGVIARAVTPCGASSSARARRVA